MNAKPIKKLYFSISEVAELTGLKQYVLRYWETEFEELKPSKNRAGNRIYKERDIEYIRKIKDLLYNKKFTIEGARNYLYQMGKKERTGEVTASQDEQPKKLIKSIQNELEEILHILEE